MNLKLIGKECYSRVVIEEKPLYVYKLISTKFKQFV
jgi:hypothetical protein